MKWLVGFAALGVLAATLIWTRCSNAIALTGMWSDACPCQIPCPCWHTAHASTHDCQNVQVFLVEQFKHGRSTRRDLAFVIVGWSKHPFEAPEPAVVYIPDGSDADTARLIGDLVRRLLGNAASFEVVRAPIQYRLFANEHEVVIPGILAYRISSQNRPPHESVARSLYPWLTSPVQGVTKEVSYSHAGKSFRYRGTHALFARLRLEE